MRQSPADEAVLRAALDASIAWLGGLEERPAGARSRVVPEASSLPDKGVGAVSALADLVRRAETRAAGSAGPRYFHYVIGGATPAALAADWFASALDQVASSSSGSPLAIDLEEIATAWLIELFHLGAPDSWTGLFTTGATMANFVGLGAARQWWGEALGVDVGTDGLSGLPRPAILTGGYVHASVLKSLGMLGLGRASVERFTRDNDGALDVAALAQRLTDVSSEACQQPGQGAGLRGPAIVIATAGEVNAGSFDPIEEIADLCEEHGAWLHVDGAFGLFARVSDETRALAAGVERANSVAVDVHKWLNVPYDCGVAFVRQRALLAKTFRMVADYLPKSRGSEGVRRVPGSLGPESSRRARALPVFATLLAYGREGVRDIVEGHLALARHLASLVRAEPDLELLADPCLNVVTFRAAPLGVRKRDLDALNEAVAVRVAERAEVVVGTTRYRGRVAFRPAIANWRTREADVEVLVDEIKRALGSMA
ncbi:MAG: pyridoxal-dependent decarboxylase [Planctomycetota bacterium]